MTRCTFCGTKIKPWYEVCFECNQTTKESLCNIPQPIIAKDFMKNMKIDGWE